MEQGQSFDLAELFRRIDAARSEGNLTWTAVSERVGVAASTIRRFGTASDAEADGVLVLIGWLGVPPEEFIANSSVDGVVLLPRRDGVIRVDMKRVSELMGSSARNTVGMRTSIQRLVTATQAAEVSVASVTRWSPT